MREAVDPIDMPRRQRCHHDTLELPPDIRIMLTTIIETKVGLNGQQLDILKDHTHFGERIGALF